MDPRGHALFLFQDRFPDREGGIEVSFRLGDRRERDPAVPAAPVPQGWPAPSLRQ
jgi:hypothetical protein